MWRCVSVFCVCVYHSGEPRSFITPSAGPPSQSNAAVAKPASTRNVGRGVQFHLTLPT
jgi:hypothetical protein